MRLILGRACASIALLMLAGSLVSLPASGLWPLEMFAHFRVQYLATSVLLLPVCLFLRDWRSTGLLLATLVLNGALVAAWYGDRKPVAHDGQPVRILHLNVHSSNDAFQRTLDLIAAADADIILLQEVTPRWQHALEPLAASHPYGIVRPRRGNFGIAMLSRLPLENVRRTPSPPLGYPTLSAQLTIDGRTTTLITTHPTIPLGSSLYRARNTQLDSVAGLIRSASARVVLVGDLNASLWDPALRAFAAATGLVSARRGFGIQPSWPSYLPPTMIPIDHVLVSPDIPVLSFETAADVGSDHLPLVVTLAL